MNFFDFTIIGKRAESLAQYLTKGKPVILSGEMRARIYTTKTGEKRTAYSILVNDVAFQHGAKDDREPGRMTAQYRQDKKPGRQAGGYPKQQKNSAPEYPMDGPESFNDDEIPF